MASNPRTCECIFVSRVPQTKRDVRYPLRANVDDANMNRLRVLPGKVFGFPAVDGGSLTDPQQREKFLSNFMAPKELSLKINCQVMLIKNTDETLVNGSMGKVIGFRSAAEHHAITTGITVDEAAERKNINKNSGRMYPLVRFSVFDAMANKTFFREVLVQSDTWKLEGQNGEVLVSRTQARAFSSVLKISGTRLKVVPYRSH